MRRIRSIILAATLLALFSAHFASAMLYAQDIIEQDAIGQDANGVDANAEAAAIMSGRVAEVFGDYPLSGVEIHLINPLSPGEPIVAAITDQSGYYTVTQLLTGTWIVRFVPRDLNANYLAEYYNDVYDIEDATPITLNASTHIANIDASLSYVGQVNGRVTADADGAPIANVQVARVHAATGMDELYATTDSSGVYTLTSYQNEPFILRFDPPDGSPYAVEYYNDKDTLSEADSVVGLADRVLHLETSLGIGGAIMGTVRSSWLDKPLEWPFVKVFTADGELVQSGGKFSDDPDMQHLVAGPGSYGIFNLAPGQYRLRYQAERHRPTSYPTLITVEAGKTTPNIDVRLVISPEVISIATSPFTPKTILITLRHDPKPLITLDGGVSWQILPSTTWLEDEDEYASPDRYQYTAIVAGIVPRSEAGTGARLLIAAGRSLYSDNGLRTGIYRSGDNGQSWAESPIDLPLTEGDCLESQFRTPATPLTEPANIYLINRCITSGFSRLLVSQDYGVSWRDVTTIDARTLLLRAASRVVPSPQVAGELYIYDGTSQWYRSRDRGLHWQTVAFPLESLVINTDNANLMAGWTSRHNAPYTRIGKRSEDGGATWRDWVQQPCPTSFLEEPPQLIAHPTEANVLFLRCDNIETPGIYRSDSYGDFWKRLTKDPGQLLAMDYGAGEPGIAGSKAARVLWAKDDGLWASADLGETWHLLLPEYRSGSAPLYLPTVIANP